ncbi:hypothetical protein HALLA_12100 [Halostagnicola larsenii XH-48]|uniref:Uncharacterized protein n=1 Tax=Halostagnicola larsenii XH-48 TaxID=797299 RepID=W0JV52_9EURY|nr:hypothetical protein [Halostagnicola larsenii]AHG00918.1 hypothetical protein HALLA_11800 [Halostagnicola larsenii XH-48]AHG00967.1 hypothetical protein HALLA_12100 [Halostagnicola larsenii XH-48]
MPGHTLFPSITPDTDDTDDVDPVAKLADANYQTAISKITAGDVDDLLDDLEEVDDRSSVQNAIEDRREALAGRDDE